MTQIGYIRESSIKDNIYRYQVGNQSSIAFTLTPVEGQASLFVNPGVLPIDDSKFYFQETSSVGKRIIISKTDLDNMKMTEPVLFP